MKLSIVPLFATVLLAPIQAYASSPAPAPEPVSLILLGTGLAGLGVAELIRRRREK
jgi:MYXO-CTERM domain-containing protein